MKNKLTIKQSTFIEEYLVDLNATQAAIRAGYSEKTAKDIGCQNLAKPNIQKAIILAMRKRAKSTGITADKVIAEIAKIGFAEIDETIRPADKLKGLELLGKHLGMFDSKFGAANCGVTINMNYGNGKAPKMIRHGVTINADVV